MFTKIKKKNYILVHILCKNNLIFNNSSHFMLPLFEELYNIDAHGMHGTFSAKFGTLQ